MKSFTLDQLDQDIIDILEVDCSLTYEEIAGRTGKSIWTVRDRIILLKQRGVIEACRAKINYGKIGLGCRAAIGFNVPPEKIDEFIAQVRKEKRIKKFMITTGSRRFHIQMVGEECKEVRDYAKKILPKFDITDIDFEVILDEIM